MKQGPAADIEAAAHGALWESTSDTSGEADDPTDACGSSAWTGRWTSSTSVHRGLPCIYYLGVMQGRMRLAFQQRGVVEVVDCRTAVEL